MSSVAIPLPVRSRLGPGSRVLLVLVASVVTIGVFVWLHKGVPLPYATFRGACERLRASGLPITERDWFCHPIPWTARTGFVAASLLAAAAFALPCAILAATGRRLSALAPLLALPLVTHPAMLYANDLLWWQGTWPASRVAGILVSVALILVPAGLVIAVRRPRIPSRVRIPVVAAAAAGITCGLAILPIRYPTDAMFERHFAMIGGSFDSRSFLWPAVAMALFAAVLGPDRRWWPWTLAPAALLLSFAPAAALLVGPEGILDWSLFGAVVPLFLVGLVWSAWRPLAFTIARRLDRARPAVVGEGVVDGSAVAPRDPARHRPAIVGGFAAAVLCLSLVVFVADPLPAQIGTALPTYLGVRGSVGDLRMKMNLRTAMEAMDRYRSETGSYEGFDEAAGVELEPTLAWTTRSTMTPLRVWIVDAGTDVARVAGVSDSGNAFCLQRTSDGLTYGTARGEFGGSEQEAALRAAISACDRAPWTDAALQAPPWRTMCTGLDRAGGYLICRMVQALNATTLRHAKPAEA
jgi:hypothetical protein